MSHKFEKLFEAGWRHVDPNGHVANMVYLEYAVDTRIAYFASKGFKPVDFYRLEFGVVIKSDLVEYFHEVKMLDKVTVTMENGGISPDFSRFRVVNNFFRDDGMHAARVTSIGGWLGLENRKLIEPPDELKAAWSELSVTEDFEELRSSIKR
jgi:acyl-CoA thioester hydrolase